MSSPGRQVPLCPASAVALRRRARPASWWMLALSALLASAPALAQFKVVEPGGRVTYTDRPPAYQSVPDARAVSPAGAPQAGTAEGLAAGLPYTLRQVVLRFPVRLVVGSGCPPCESARRLLRSRGVPVQELSVDRPEDVERLQRDFGSRELPVLLVGRERQVGYAEAAWLATLDAAGYPATPMLPTGYRAPAPQPLAGPRAVAEAPDAERAEPPAPVVSPLSGGGIRF